MELWPPIKDAERWKEEGNKRLKAEDECGAMDCYERGIEAGERHLAAAPGAEGEEERGAEEAAPDDENMERLKKVLSLLHSNRAHVLMMLRSRPGDAVQAGFKATTLDPTNGKAYWRASKAAMLIEHYEVAAQMCKNGIIATQGLDCNLPLQKLLCDSVEAWENGAFRKGPTCHFNLAEAYKMKHGIEEEEHMLRYKKHMSNAAACGATDAQRIVDVMYLEELKALADTAATGPGTKAEPKLARLRASPQHAQVMRRVDASELLKQKMASMGLER